MDPGGSLTLWVEEGPVLSGSHSVDDVGFEAAARDHQMNSRRAGAEVSPLHVDGSRDVFAAARL